MSTTYPQFEQYHLPLDGPQDDEELWHWMRAVWGVTIPRTPVCPQHCTPFEAFADAYFARHTPTIWKASRGYGGKSRLLAALGMQEAVFLPAQVSVLGGSGAQSLNVHAHMVEMWDWEKAPRAAMTQAPTKFDTYLHRKAWIRSLMASPTSVRGPHPQRLRMDEIDEMTLEILEGAMGQTMRATRGPQVGIETQIVLSSTHQHADGTMTEMLKRAADEGWKVYEWCYRESANPVDGWLTLDEVERKRREIPEHMWRTEYDLQEPSIEGRAFNGEAVDAAFSLDLDTVGVIEELRWTDPEHAPGSNRRPLHPLYVTGVDWAKERDLTVIATFDARDSGDWHCVAWEAINKAPWPYMVGLAERRYKDYPPVFAHDSTGLGDVIEDYFDPELKRTFRRSYKAVILGGGRARHDLFSDYIAAIEAGKIRYPRITKAYDEHRYCLLEDLYGTGHPPDSVVAGAIAWAQRGKGRIQAVSPITIEREAPWRPT